MGDKMVSTRISQLSKLKPGTLYSYEEPAFQGDAIAQLVMLYVEKRRFEAPIATQVDAMLRFWIVSNKRTTSFQVLGAYDMTTSNLQAAISRAQCVMCALVSA